MKKALLAIFVLPFALQASSIRPPVRQVAMNLKNIEITEVGTKGAVLKRNHAHPYTNFQVSIPITVSTGSACVNFVGLEQHKEEHLLEIAAKGAFNPLTEACIEIFPMPVKTVAVVDFSVLTGGFVAADPIQKRTVQFEGIGLHQVTLDMNRGTVSVEPIRRYYR